MNRSTVIIVFLLTFGHLLFPPRNTNSQNSNKLLQFPLEACVIGVHWIDINVLLETPVINSTDVYKLIVLISVNNITLPHSSTYTCRMESFFFCFFLTTNHSYEYNFAVGCNKGMPARQYFERSAAKWHFKLIKNFFSFGQGWQMNSHPLNSGAIIGHWFLNLPRKKCHTTNK